MAMKNIRSPQRCACRLDSADTATRTYEARYVLDGLLANAPLGATVTLNIQDNKAEGQGHAGPAGLTL